MQLMASIGAILAGLFMLVVQGGGLLKAMQSGVIVSKSYGAPRIERATERERFDKLIKQRAAALTPALILIVIGLGLLAQVVFVILQTSTGA